MQRKLYKKEERGLKGGPNYQVSEMMGSVTTTGYWPDSPDRNNDFNIIPSNEITMEGMDIPLMGMDNLGNTQYMIPGNNYTFPGSYVTETPIAKQGGMYLGAYKQVGGQLVPHDISVPNLSRQEGGDMPFGLPLKEQNIYTLPEYVQPINPMTGEILPDPQRPNLGMDTNATEYKYTYGFDEGDVDVPSIVAGQYIGDQALDRYRLTGERFKTMADPGSYSKFYDQIGQLGLMQEKHGGAVKKVKIKSLPKNWKSQ